TVQMRLYTLTKRQFVIVFVAFIVAFSCSVFIGIAGPQIITSHRHSAVRELNVPPQKLLTGPFKVDTGLLSAFSQQMWLLCHFNINGTKKGTSFSVNFKIGVEIRGRVKDTSYHLIATSYNRTRHVKCDDQKCSNLVLLHLGYIDYPSYAVQVKFNDLSFPSGIFLDDVIFTLKHYNGDFTQVEIWFRFVFLVMAFVVTCMFAHSLRRFSLKHWSIEQKYDTTLLTKVYKKINYIFKDPLFPLNFLVNSWVPAMFDSLFQALFLCALLLFWLCAFHGIRQSDRRFIPFYFPKLLIVGLLWVSAFVLSTWQQYNELRDPTYQYKIDIGHFMGVKVFFFTVGGIYLVYLIYLLIRAYSELKAMPYFEFLTFYGLLNFYLYTMAFVYSPSKNALYDSYFREPSTFSMINESDEEDQMIYSSKKDPDRSPYSSSSED
ncbi:hypothetical protein QZH41_010498, partial [Actinostola sp. cb2023]